MFAPLRSVFSMQLMTCDMSASTSKAALSSIVMASAEHRQHMMDSAIIDDRDSHQVDHMMKSCCDDDAPCKSHCHFSLSASLFLQRADYSPALLNAVTYDMISSALIVRELCPPSRPPLSPYS
jgi:hypothetical protein